MPRGGEIIGDPTAKILASTAATGRKLWPASNRILSRPGRTASKLHRWGLRETPTCPSCGEASGHWLLSVGLPLHENKWRLWGCTGMRRRISSLGRLGCHVIVIIYDTTTTNPVVYLYCCIYQPRMQKDQLINHKYFKFIIAICIMSFLKMRFWVPMYSNEYCFILTSKIINAQVKNIHYSVLMSHFISWIYQLLLYSRNFELKIEISF